MSFLRAAFMPYVLLLVSVTPLALALLSQYGFGLHPCTLCLWQRVPYALLIVLALLAVLRPAALGRIICLSALLWLSEAGLAFYHVGVEQHWWASAGGCSATGEAATSLDALRAQILNAPLVACDQPEFVFAGVSMAGWNVLYSLAMLLGCGLWIQHRRRAAG